MKIWPFLTAIALMAAAPVFAQALSEAEIAAQSQSGLTDADREALTLGCKLNADDQQAQDASTLTVATDVTGILRHLRGLTILKSVVTLYKGPETDLFEIVGFDDLPNGGIGRRDYCWPVQVLALDPPTSKGDELQTIGLLLRDGLDIAQDYPNTSTAIFERDLLIEIPSSEYLLLDGRDGKVEDWLKQHAESWAAENNAGPMIRIGSMIAVRLGGADNQ